MNSNNGVTSNSSVVAPRRILMTHNEKQTIMDQPNCLNNKLNNNPNNNEDRLSEE